MREALREYRGRKKFFLLVFLELILAVLTVFSALNLFGFNFFKVIEEGKYSFSFSPNLFEIVFFVFSIFALLMVFFAIKSQPLLYSAQKKAWFEIKKATKQKIVLAKADFRVLAMLLIEFMFVVIVFISLSAFFDTGFELIPWSKFNEIIPWDNLKVYAPETTFINAIIAVLVLYAFYWLYSQAASLKQEKPMPFQGAKKRKKK